MAYEVSQKKSSPSKPQGAPVSCHPCVTTQHWEAVLSVTPASFYMTQDRPHRQQHVSDLVWYRSYLIFF